MMEYVVDFKLPNDPSMFVHHGTNAVARNAREAIAEVVRRIPDAIIRSAEPGLVVLYGAEYATWDESLGAPCSPMPELYQQRVIRRERREARR